MFGELALRPFSSTVVRRSWSESLIQNGPTGYLEVGVKQPGRRDCEKLYRAIYLTPVATTYGVFGLWSGKPFYRLGQQAMALDPVHVKLIAGGQPGI